MTESDAIGGALDDAPDGALVRAAVRGDDAAFGRLVHRYLRRAMAVALEYAPTRDDAEDIVQDTFRRVVENLDRFDPERAFEPWFFTILRNTARNSARSRRVRSHDPLPLDYPSRTPDPYEDARRLQLRERIAGAIDGLPPMQRRCFRLCAVEGLTSGEAASALGLAESTVRVHVFKARNTLQVLLEQWRDEAEEA